MRHFVIMLACSVIGFRASADSLAPDRPVIFSPEYTSDIFFTMVPAKYGQDYKLERAAYGIAYKLDAEGGFKELYRTHGWYSAKVFISLDGVYLVRMGPWNAGYEPSKEDLAVAFYKRGKLLKQYSTAELVRDASKVEVTTSHYNWLAPSWIDDKLNEADRYRLRQYLGSDNVFHLHTIDGWTYSFDAMTGKIKSREKTTK